MRFILGLCLAIFSVSSFAGGQTAWAVPTEIHVVRNEGIMVYGAFGNPAGCTVSDRIFVALGTTQYNQIYATLMTAFAMGKEISAYAGSCSPVTWYSVPSTTYNTVTTGEAVYLRN